MKNSLYTREWLQLEHNSRFYWQLLQELPEAVLRRQPAPEKWSMLQIMEHLLAVEAGSLQYLLRKNYTPLVPRGLPGPIRGFILKMALLSPLKFKAPAIDALQPHNTSRPKELLERWHTVREKMAAYIEALPPGREKSLLFRHPLAGALTLHQTLQFIAEHMSHHKRQVQAQLKQQDVKLAKQ